MTRFEFVKKGGGGGGGGVRGPGLPGLFLVRGNSPGVVFGAHAGLELDTVPRHILRQLVYDGLDVRRRGDDDRGRWYGRGRGPGHWRRTRTVDDTIFFFLLIPKQN